VIARAASALGAALWLAGPALAGETVDCVLAKVNDEIITLGDYLQQRKQVLEEIYRQNASEAETRQRIEQARDRLLPSLIEERLLLQKASSLGLTTTSEEADRIVKSIMEQNRIVDEADLERRLKAEGMTLAELRANITRRSLIEKVKQFEIAAKVVVTEEEAKRYYEEHREEFREPERVRLREIVLLTDKREPEQVRKEIEEIAALIRNGADFAELATLFSQAPSSEQGGDLGLLQTGELAPEIAEAASRLEAGQVSDPVRTRFGFHIIKLVERKPVTHQSFDEARGAIIRRIQEERYGSRVDAYLAELRSAAFVQVIESCETHAR
jgi:peptidyl-prolyl cis-trans isomerase SurA